MADIVDFSQEIDAFLRAKYGENVRSALVSIANKLALVINTHEYDTDETLTDADRAAQAKAVGDILYGGRDESHLAFTVPARFTGAFGSDATLIDLPNNTWMRLSGSELKGLLDSDASFVWSDELKDNTTYIIERRFSTSSGLSAWTIRNLGGHTLYTGTNLSGALTTINWANRNTDASLSIANRAADAAATHDALDALQNLIYENRNLIYANRNDGENTPIPIVIYTPPTVPDDWETSPEWDRTDLGCVVVTMPGNSRFNTSGRNLRAYLPSSFRWLDEIEDSLTYNVDCRVFTSSSLRNIYIHAINSGIEYYGWTLANRNLYWKKFQYEKTARILFIGNSYTEDAIAYAPFIIRELAPGMAFRIGISYISGGTTADYEDSFYNDTDVPTYFKISGAASAWTNLGNKTIKDILDDEPWDMIFFNGIVLDEGSDPPTYDDFNSFLDDIVLHKMQSQSTPVRYGFLDAQRRLDRPYITFEIAKLRETTILNTTPLDCVIPCGTAVEIARTTSLDSVGDYGHLAEDANGHMQEGLPRLLTAYTTTLALLSFCGINWKGIVGHIFRPTDAWVTSIAVPGKQGSVTGVDDANCLLAQKCAVAAMRKPYELSVVV